MYIPTYYVNDAHQKFFMRMCLNFHFIEYSDIYRCALFYCIGATETSRNHINEIYDFEEGSIHPECLRSPWQTSTSWKMILLGFDLYHNGPVDNSIAFDRASPSHLFSGDLFIAKTEALKIRFFED